MEFSLDPTGLPNLRLHYIPFMIVFCKKVTNPSVDRKMYSTICSPPLLEAYGCGNEWAQVNEAIRKRYTTTNENNPGVCSGGFSRLAR